MPSRFNPAFALHRLNRILDRSDTADYEFSRALLSLVWSRPGHCAFEWLFLEEPQLFLSCLLVRLGSVEAKIGGPVAVRHDGR